MNMLFAEIMPSIREIPGFSGFSKLKRGGALCTGLEKSVSDPGGIQAEVNKLTDVQFPSQFSSHGDHRWIHPDGRVIVEKRSNDYHIRYYDTVSGFESDSRVSI